jgi:hypothetical protein
MDSADITDVEEFNPWKVIIVISLLFVGFRWAVGWAMEGAEMRKLAQECEGDAEDAIEDYNKISSANVSTLIGRKRKRDALNLSGH